MVIEAPDFLQPLTPEELRLAGDELRHRADDLAAQGDIARSDDLYGIAYALFQQGTAA